jgi:RHS repeat-associated protein
MTRRFLSVDPMDLVVGSGWAGNPYSFAGNDPLHAIDPLGLRFRRVGTLEHVGPC